MPRGVGDGATCPKNAQKRHVLGTCDLWTCRKFLELNKRRVCSAGGMHGVEKVPKSEGSGADCKATNGRSTLQGINISHLGERKIIFKMLFLGDMLVPWRVF